MARNNEQKQSSQQEFSNFETFSDSLRAYDLDIRQLDRGLFTANLQQIQCGNVWINRISGTRRLEVYGNPPPGLITFGVPTNRCQPFIWRNKFSTANTIQFYKPNTELEMITHPFFEAIDISITENRFNQLMRRWELPELNEIINKREMISCNPEKLQQLRATLQSICVALYNNPILLKQSAALQHIIKFEVPYLLTQALMPPKADLINPTPDKRSHVLKRAVDYIKSTPQKSASIRQLCFETGINERTLQRVFLERYGMPPKSYMQAYHLNNVYKALTKSNSGSTYISDIAGGFGYLHMSQLAQDYRRHFGQLPSETLKPDAGR